MDLSWQDFQSILTSSSKGPNLSLYRATNYPFLEFIEENLAKDTLNTSSIYIVWMEYSTYNLTITLYNRTGKRNRQRAAQ